MISGLLMGIVIGAVVVAVVAWAPIYALRVKQRPPKHREVVVRISANHEALRQALGQAAAAAAAFEHTSTARGEGFNGNAMPPTGPEFG